MDNAALFAVPRSFAIGSYTPGERPVAGITIARQTALRAPFEILQRIDVPNASFIASAGNLMLAVSEQSAGALVRLQRTTAGWEVTARVDLDQADPCHITILPGGGLAVISNYSSGSVTTVVLAQHDGLGVPRTIALPTGSGPVVDRQADAHAHSTMVTDRGTILVADLGSDRIHEYALDVSGLGDLVGTVELPAGSGPRHLAFADGSLFVVGELDSTLYRYARETSTSAAWVLTDSISTFDRHAAEFAASDNFPSHIEISGHTATVANRGRDTVSTISFAGGELRLLSERSTGGPWPRHFVSVGGDAGDRPGAVADGTRDCLYIAAERGAAILELDSGETPLTVVAQIDSPSCICVLTP